MRWMTLTVRGMSLLESLEDVVMAMSSALIGDMGLPEVTLLALRLAHSPHTPTHILTTSLRALVRLPPNHILTMSHHAPVGVIEILRLPR
jgi:hypothetical protein